jgi:phosphoserine phosphatase
MKKLCVFDFDSTLMDGETIDFLASAANCEDEVAKITHAAMMGELDFFEALEQRVAMLKGLELKVATDICENLPFIKNAKECIKELKDNGYTVLVFSGGFSLATSFAKTKLGFDMDFSNTLHNKDGVLSGLVGGEMMFSSSKGVMLQKMQSLLNISYDNTVAVGDGANDKSMFLFAKTKIAFCAKPALREAANIIVDERDLLCVARRIIL